MTVPAAPEPEEPAARSADTIGAAPTSPSRPLADTGLTGAGREAHIANFHDAVNRSLGKEVHNL